jgi:hypothetical protein
MDYAAFLDGIVHEETQTDSPGFDLTVAEIHEITEPGRIDFGGGELEPAETTPHETTKRNPDDDYSWWHLEAGQYLLEFNESIAADDVEFTLQPRRELLERGGSHPTVRVTELPRVPLAVGGAGLRLKENARVSTLIAAETP